MKKVSFGILGLLVIVGVIVLASYWFSVKTHREVVEHRPAAPDIPGALFYDLSLAGSDDGKAFTGFMREQTRQIEMPTFHMEVTWNPPQYFRLLARAEAKPGEDPESLYKMYKERFNFENQVVFTVMMHSAAGHLFDYRLDRFTFLKSNGKEFKPAEWIESNRSSDYHRRGMLLFKRPPDMKEIKLALKDTSGFGKEVILEWSGKEID